MVSDSLSKEKKCNIVDKICTPCIFFLYSYSFGDVDSNISRCIRRGGSRERATRAIPPPRNDFKSIKSMYIQTIHLNKISLAIPEDASFFRAETIFLKSDRHFYLNHSRWCFFLFLVQTTRSSKLFTSQFSQIFHVFLPAKILDPPLCIWVSDDGLQCKLHV